MPCSDDSNSNSNSNSRAVHRAACLSWLRFINNLHERLPAVLILFTHCQNTTARKLLTSLEKKNAASHFVDVKPFIDHMIQLLNVHGENLLVSPADDLGAERLPKLRKIVHDMASIENVREVLNSPLSEKALLQLTVAAKAMMVSVEERIRKGEDIRTFSDDLDEFQLISNSLDVPAVSQNYGQLVRLVADHIVQHCEKALVALEDHKIIDVRYHMDRLEGFDCLSEHFAAQGIDLKQQHYVPLVATLNKRAQHASHVIETAKLSSAEVVEQLDLLHQFDQSLRQYFSSNNQRAYTQSVLVLTDRFSELNTKASSCVENARFDAELSQCLSELKSMSSFTGHLEDQKFYEELAAELLRVSRCMADQLVTHLAEEDGDVVLERRTGGDAASFHLDLKKLLSISHLSTDPVPEAAEFRCKIALKVMTF